jgi:type I restriction enzyme S subunit
MSRFSSSLSTEERKDVALANANGISWFLGIPSGWRIARFKNLFQEIYRYPTYYNIEYVSDGIPEVRGEALTPEGFIMKLDDERYISNETNKLFPRTQLQLGDIVMSVRGTMGKIGVVDERYAGANITANLLRLSPDQRWVASNFLRWVMRSTYFDEALNCSAPQTTIKTITMPQLAKIPIALPPKNEQERIAAYLDTTCAGIDAAVAAKRRQIETLDAVRKSLIESAVTKGVRPNAAMRSVNEDWITEIPVDWEVCRIKRIVSRVDYGISESTEPEGRYPVLKMGHIQGGEIEFRDLDFVDEVSNDLLLETGDLLYNRTNSPDQVGKAAIFRRNKTDEITFASYLVRLRTNHRANPYFLNYLVNSSGFLSFARKLAIPSVQQSNLNSTRYCRMLIPRPPIEEQCEIVAYLDAKTAEVSRIVAGIETQIATLTAYRKSLIHECVTGQRRITEADVQRAAAQRKFDNLSLTG